MGIELPKSCYLIIECDLCYVSLVPGVFKWPPEESKTSDLVGIIWIMSYHYLVHGRNQIENTLGVFFLHICLLEKICISCWSAACQIQ